ncbi:extensin family protein [uncultured Litoreibacter sp.]|uniref:extensin-like domain-containing protein n=1 Tax=uncultured Litoreibacter sp. TaxID=1392394 RepID=UPI002639B88E|nr:extensin family protein [uncultured Litoreibacter sp.]
MRAFLRLAVAVAGLCLIGGLGYLALTHPSTPVPREWNPTKRLYLSDPVTLMTPWKLDAATSEAALCKEVLAEGRVTFRDMADREISELCHIRGRVTLEAVGAARLKPVETTCAVALRTAMWERHGLQPAAQAHLGTTITGIGHFSSYNCRQIRSTSGTGGRMSLHATAEAIDVFGFTLADGRQLVMKRDWDRENAFFKAARDSACTWFKTTLGPDYNALHADHFHLQSRGWGTCR